MHRVPAGDDVRCGRLSVSAQTIRTVFGECSQLRGLFVAPAGLSARHRPESWTGAGALQTTRHSAPTLSARLRSVFSSENIEPRSIRMLS
jgi:hypothetical protein